MSFVGLVALESSQVFGGRSGNRMLSLPYMIAVGMGLHNLGEGWPSAPATPAVNIR